MENQSNDNELCQQTVTYIKSKMEDNFETVKFRTVNCIEIEKSRKEGNIEREKIQIENDIKTDKSHMEDTIETECSMDNMDMQRAPSHITVANWSRKNTPTKQTNSSDSVIIKEADTLSKQDSKTKLVKNSDIDNITENIIGTGNTKLCMNVESTSDSLHTKDENEYRLASNNDEEIKSKSGDRLSEGVPDDDTYSNALNKSLQSITHVETFRSCMDCIKPVQVKTWKEIKLGDHIILSRSFYDHHAIVIRVIEPKDDNSNLIDLELIHQTNSTMGAFWDKIRPLGSLAKLQCKIETVDLKRDIVMICKYWGSIKPSSPEEVVERAIGALKVDQEEFRYDIIDNNCEHFASWCVTGTRLSVQIRKVTIVLKIFFRLKKGFRGLSDELLRNKEEYDHGMLCEMCFERNKKMLSVPKIKVLKKDQIQKGDIILYSYFKLLHCSVVLDVLRRKDKYIKCEIAHYAFKGPFTQKKIQSDILKVPFNESVSIFDYSQATDFKTYDPEEVVRRAKERLGEQMFSYFSNDSSHFARWCKLKLK